MPLITDWLMVAITVVYVIATIFICIFNGSSAKATQKQITESQRQFDEARRLEYMPFLQLEKASYDAEQQFEIEVPLHKGQMNDTIYAKLWLKNVGNGTATNIIYSWQDKFFGIEEVGYPPINAVMSRDKYCFQLTIEVDDDIDEISTALIVFNFDDLLGSTYEQKVILCIEEREVVRCENDVPKFCGCIQYQVAHKN